MEYEGCLKSLEPQHEGGSTSQQKLRNGILGMQYEVCLKSFESQHEDGSTSQSLGMYLRMHWKVLAKISAILDAPLLFDNCLSK